MTRSRAARRRRRLGPFVALALVVLLGACSRSPGSGGSSGPTRAAEPASDAEFGAVAPFRFTERGGRAVAREDLLGEVWLVAFVFTRCSTVCPAMTAEMARAQDLLSDSSVRLVSISVDPEHDTPAVLSEYARDVAGADPERWWFLTGDEDEIYALIQQSFRLPVARDDALDIGIAISHSSELIAVDAEGRIRGYYNVAESGGVESAVARARYLAGERSPLPLLNAFLNATAGVLLVAGLLAIRARRERLHAGLMRSAFVASALFLASYLYYHFVVIPAQGGPVKFGGSGALKGLYLALLLTHVVGAVVNLPMVLTTLWFAHRERWESHKRWARRTFPLWLYVSVTGVLVYLALYPLNPTAG